MTGCLIPSGFGLCEHTEKRSRFIGRVWPVENEEEALHNIKETRAGHWDATHNVYAYSVREGGIARFSDDGEPSGTAGMPVLEVFRREGIENFCCVVTRYFGGVLLGAGGLIRAYAHSAKLALDAAGVSVVNRWVRGSLLCPYPMFERIKLEISAAGGILGRISYGEEVVIEVLLPETGAEGFAARVADVSNGRMEFFRDGEEFRAVKRG